ncbi:metallophosphoesterase family protein [Pseudothermotoga thermarum]|uniref:Phosphoesterase n=1 Tax=Pseudothermotoga thermarum DSM 5069 TaxID=688269 RepID=F7YXZ6_9THEM|nr:YfcE family phosphodiesterase [Pseudothermotoga thermarum]AEH50797.1 phosphodiesterase, MJ0936 family [Pseudothermotoga thermarum DSM 5069]
MKILLVSDLHIPVRLSSFPEELIEQLPNFDCVIGLGDYVDLDTVLVLKKFSKQFYGVHGNMDYPDVKEYLPATLTINLMGYTIGLCHGWGPPFGLREKILNLFSPKPQIIFYGHTHETDHSKLSGTTFVNPGSLGESGNYAVVELCKDFVKVEFKRLQKS